MQVSFSAQDVHELFAEWKTSKKATFLHGINEQIIQFPERICDGWMRRSQLRSGLDMVIQQVQCQDPLSLELKEKGNISVLRLAFGITGQTKGVVADENQEIQFQAGRFCIGFASEANSGTVEYDRGQTNLLSAYLDLEVLNTLINQQFEDLPRELGQILDGQFIPLYFQSGRMTAAMKLVTQQIMACPFEGLTKRLYLESKILELLALSLHEITEQPPASPQQKRLKSSDLEYVHQARDILLNNLDNPPSLLQLAHLVGLNDYKLKIGFRQVFGTTVFGYLYQCRMERAQALLASGKFSVAAVAESVGYTSLSAFSTAFKRKFGINPNAYKLNRVNQ